MTIHWSAGSRERSQKSINSFTSIVSSSTYAHSTLTRGSSPQNSWSVSRITLASGPWLAKSNFLIYLPISVNQLLIERYILYCYIQYPRNSRFVKTDQSGFLSGNNSPVNGKKTPLCRGVFNLLLFGQERSGVWLSLEIKL